MQSNERFFYMRSEKQTDCAIYQHAHGAAQHERRQWQRCLRRITRLTGSARLYHAQDAVKRGQKVAVLESMKMENEILAEKDGIIKDVFVTKGDQLSDGDRIVSIA